MYKDDKSNTNIYFENIDKIDKQITDLFCQRLNVIEQIVDLEKENKLPLEYNKRSEDVLKRNLDSFNCIKYFDIYKNFISNLNNISSIYEKAEYNKELIGYQGIIGAFSYIAANKLFPFYQMRSFTTFGEVVKAVLNDDIKYGVIPFENSYTGEVGEISELLKENNVYINKTYDLKIDQNLLGVKGAKITDIKNVYSHPQAISQSNLFLKGRNFNVIAYPNTAIAAKFVSETNDVSNAAIASKETAKIYDLDIIEPNINTSDTNTTRFIVISKNYTEKGTYFQLLFTVKNKPGELANVIDKIASHGFNMENLKSHAIHDQPWSYYFHVEIKADLSTKESKDMLADISTHCTDLRILGGYDKII